MLLAKPVLVTGESILSEWAANFIISLSDYGLSRFCADDHMWTIGMKGREALGGRLFVTNYRVIFATHPVNRVVGEFSIPLELVSGVTDKSFLVLKKIVVSCTLGDFEFIIWDIARFIALVDERRRALDANAWHAVLVREKDVLTGGTLHISAAMEAANTVVKVVGAAKEIVDIATNPIEFLREALIAEALERLVKDPVNKYVGGR